MRLNEVITKAYNKKWSYNNSFSIQINQGQGSVLGNSAFITYGKELSMHIQRVNLPDIQAEAIENWVVDRYRLGMGVDQPYRFSIDFVDSDNVALWRSFLKAYDLSRNNYFDDCKLEIQVFKESDYDPEASRVHLITFKETMIESVSRIPFSNDSEAELAKFSVNFKSAVFKLDN